MSPLDRRGNFASTCVWTCALVAIAGLTIWQFEIWPVGWVATETGTIDESDAGAERFAPGPIEVAEVTGENPPRVEPAAATVEHSTPHTQIAALDLEKAMPVRSNQAPPRWPAEPGRLPANEQTRPLRPSPPALPTGSDFAETGSFPKAATPQQPPIQSAEPASLEVPATPSLKPIGDDMSAAGAAATQAPPAASEKPGSNPIINAATEQQPATTVAPASGTTPANATPSAGPVQLASAISAAPSDARLAKIDADIAANRYLVAHKALSKLYWDEPQLRSVLQARIDTTAKSIYFDPQPHYMTAYEVQPADQIRVFARNYNVPWEYLVRLNRIADPARIQAGDKLKVIKGPFSAVVNLSDFSLTVHAHGYYVRRYPVGIGKDGTTPIGSFHVVSKLTNPTYYGPDAVIGPDDPTNPLGERWIGLDDGNGQPTSYGIHGTIEPSSIGLAASQGCVRLRNEDVAEVYDLLGVGSEVIIRR
jgi:lipoprotein-anchoring transpeptidase ErfK/SrfK